MLFRSKGGEFGVYLGSVRFFKHLILTTVALLILIPSGTAIYYYTHQKSLQENLDQLNIISQTARDYIDAVEDEKMQQKNESISYQRLYPDMIVENTPVFTDDASQKMVYLTFDDGPTKRTLEILDILEQYNIKATFFVIYRGDQASRDILKAVADAGHTIGIHSGTHDYKKIYQSTEAFIEDFYTTYALVEEVTGIKADIFRFPGGSINSYNQGVYQEIIAEIGRAHV